jgi:hypothetical protein
MNDGAGAVLGRAGYPAISKNFSRISIVMEVAGAKVAGEEDTGIIVESKGGGTREPLRCNSCTLAVKYST